MDSTILLFLLQDGLMTGVIYALLAVVFVLLFTVTRVIFIPQGDLVAYGGLSLATLEAGRMPALVWLLVALGVASGALDLLHRRRSLSTRAAVRIAGLDVALPLLIAAAAYLLAPLRLGLPVSIPLTLAIVAPLGVHLYRVAFQPLAGASILTLLIVSVGVHWALTGLGLMLFGAEGYKVPALSDAVLALGPVDLPVQSLVILLATAGMLALLYAFFGRTLQGKALRAAAVSARGARLVGISPTVAGRRAFGLAALLAGLSGILIAPVTTLYYDSGFLIGLKGFVGAIVGGLSSYPISLLASLFVGLTESFSAFWASAFKEAIVFGIILPVLAWRSVFSPHPEEE